LGQVDCDVIRQPQLAQIVAGQKTENTHLTSWGQANRDRSANRLFIANECLNQIADRGVEELDEGNAGQQLVKQTIHAAADDIRNQKSRECDETDSDYETETRD